MKLYFLAESSVRLVRFLIYFLCGCLVLLLRPKVRDKALVVRLDAIGDFFVWLNSGATDTLTFLAEGDRQVVLVVNELVADFARSVDLADRIIAINPVRFMRSPLYRMNKMIDIRMSGVGMAVSPRSARVYLQESELIRVCGARKKIAISSTPINMNVFQQFLDKQLHTKIVDVPSEVGPHQIESNLYFSAKVCGKITEPNKLAIKAPPDAGDFLRPYFVVTPGAGDSRRQWSSDKFMQLVREITSDRRIQCVILGTRADSKIAAEIGTALKYSCLDLTGKKSLSETVWLISKAEFLISNESGPMHIGAWVRTPTIGLVGGGHYGWFAPYPVSATRRGIPLITLSNIMPCFGCNWDCNIEPSSSSSYPCVDGIQVEEVVDAVKRIA